MTKSYEGRVTPKQLFDAQTDTFKELLRIREEMSGMRELMARVDERGQGQALLLRSHDLALEELQDSDKRWAGITGVVSAVVGGAIGWLLPRK